MRSPVRDLSEMGRDRPRGVSPPRGRGELPRYAPERHFHNGINLERAVHPKVPQALQSNDPPRNHQQWCGAEAARIQSGIRTDLDKRQDTFWWEYLDTTRVSNNLRETP